MRGGLARIVGFGFDDAAADPIDEQADTDQIARDIECIAAKEIAIELGAPARQALRLEKKWASTKLSIRV